MEQFCYEFIFLLFGEYGGTFEPGMIECILWLVLVLTDLLLREL